MPKRKDRVSSSPSSSRELVDGRVLCATAGFFDVQLSEGGVVRCRMRGRLKRIKKKTDLCVIGDRVQVSLSSPGLGQLEEVLPRETVFSRRHPGAGGRYKEDVLIANLDQLVTVFAHGTPPFHPRLLDRFLAIASANGINVVVVANKIDQLDSATEELFRVYEELGYTLIKCSAKTKVGVDQLRNELAGKTSALVGPSGAGKSSLVNELDQSLAIRVNETSATHGKGRHTTRVATLHPILSHRESYVADTPGIRELGTWNIHPDDLANCFIEFRPHLDGCVFRRCSHVHEPNCAVQDAVRDGAISETRYESYLRLLRDDER